MKRSFLPLFATNFFAICNRLAAFFSSRGRK